MSHIIESRYDEKTFEETIREFIDDKFKEYNLDNEFPNLLIKEDVLSILDKFCTVIYYPLYGERNNGFHIDNFPFPGEKTRNIVFINTAQTTEKQVFTAAHELGHIWNVDDKIIEKLHLKDSREQREKIINRFAAILLMPEETFRNLYRLEREKFAENGKISRINMFRVIVSLMNYFFVPQKSVILRLVELEIIPREPTASLLLGEKQLPKEEIESVVKVLLQIYGCDKFINPSNKKWIEGLADLLDSAEKKNNIPKEKIDAMRKLFELNKTDFPEQMINTFDIP